MIRNSNILNTSFNDASANHYLTEKSLIGLFLYYLFNFCLLLQMYFMLICHYTFYTSSLTFFMNQCKEIIKYLYRILPMQMNCYGKFFLRYHIFQINSKIYGWKLVFQQLTIICTEYIRMNHILCTINQYLVQSNINII